MQSKGWARRGALWGALWFALFGASAAASLPLISEVFYDQAGSDDGHSFVELYGPPGTALDGLRLEGVNGFDGGVGPVVPLAGRGTSHSGTAPAPMLCSADAFRT